METRSLKEYILSSKCEKFSPSAYFDAQSDTLSIYLKNEQSYAERVDELLTAYLTMDGERLTGVELNGVRHLLEKIGSFGVSYLNKEIDVGIILMAYVIVKPDPTEADRPRIDDFLEELSRDRISVRFDEKELALV